MIALALAILKSGQLSSEMALLWMRDHIDETAERNGVDLK